MSQVLEKEMTFVNDGLADFRFDQRGNVAIVWALMATVLMLAVGAAVDVGRWLHARDQTVAAVDAALLAGGRAYRRMPRMRVPPSPLPNNSILRIRQPVFRWSAIQSALPSATTGSRWLRMARRTSRLCFCR